MSTRKGWRESRLNTHGEAYEDFISAAYIAAIRLGKPTRAGMVRGELDDEAVTVATQELVARGLLAGTDDPDTWEVVPPRDSLPRYADAVERRMQTTRMTAAEVDALWRRAVGDRPTLAASDVDVIDGVDAVAYRIASAHRTATHHVWWAIDGSPAARLLLEEAMHGEGRLGVKEGVERRLAMDTSLLDDAAAMDFVDRFRAEGHPVVFGNGIPFSVVVADRSSAVVDLTAFDREAGSFEVRLPPPVQALTQLFEAVWTLATPYWPGLLEAPRTPDRLPLAERDQRILALLTTGASDQVIARQLAVSVRTVERRVRYLMDRLGAATRFQAGVQAARRGWL